MLVTAEDRDFLYMRLAKRIREGVEARDLEIAPIKTKRSMAGGLIYELLGDNAAERAEILLEEIKSLVRDYPDIRAIKVDKKVEIVIYGFIEVMCASDILEIISRNFNCRADLINCGQVRYNRNGVGSIKVKCPVVTAL
jgi:hypothetical protein